MPRTTYFLMLLFPILLMSACQSDQTADNAQLAELEAKAKESKSPEDIGQLIQAYEVEIQGQPEKATQNRIYLKKATDLLNESGRFSSAADFLRRILRDYPDLETIQEDAMALAGIYDGKLGDKESALSIYQALAEAYETEGAKAKITGAPSFSERMDTLLANMVDASTGRADFKVANQYITSAENYALVNPSADIAPAKLYMSAEVARSIRLHQRALEIYEWLINKFPDFEKTPKAYFMRAFTLDEDLNREELARQAYQTFIDKFPNDDFADDAQILIDNLGKSDEEIFQQFEQ